MFVNNFSQNYTRESSRREKSHADIARQSGHFYPKIMTNRKACQRLFTLLAIHLRIASKKIAMQNHGNAQQQRRVDITALQQFRNVGGVHKQFPCQPRSAALLRFQFFFDQIANVNVVGHFLSIFFQPQPPKRLQSIKKVWRLHCVLSYYRPWRALRQIKTTAPHRYCPIAVHGVEKHQIQMLSSTIFVALKTAKFVIEDNYNNTLLNNRSPVQKKQQKERYHTHIRHFGYAWHICKSSQYSKL